MQLINFLKRIEMRMCMGRIKTRAIKRFTEELVSRHLDKFTDDYYKNKALLKSFSTISSQKQANVIAGYVTKLVKLKKQQS